jgi:hypothetical protein
MAKLAIFPGKITHQLLYGLSAAAHCRYTKGRRQWREGAKPGKPVRQGAQAEGIYNHQVNRQ